MLVLRVAVNSIKVGVQETMMKFHLICMILISTEAFAKNIDEVTTVEHITDEEGTEYTLNVTKTQDEEDIVVNDIKGNPMITVEMMENEGYQIDKPANENVCLLSKIEENTDSTDTEKSSSPLCYDRVMYAVSNMSQVLQNHCSGRDIYALVPRNCSANETNDANNDKDDSRVKRGLWRCYWYSYYTVKMCRYSHCCWFCRRTCYSYRLCLKRVYYLKCGFYG